MPVGQIIPQKGEDYIPVVVPADVVYEAMLLNIDKRAKKDGKEFLIWTFEIISGSQKGKKIPGYSDAAITTKNKSGKWLAAAQVLVEVGKPVDMDKVINKPCNISTKTVDRTMPTGKTVPSSSVEKVYAPAGREPLAMVEGPVVPAKK